MRSHDQRRWDRPWEWLPYALLALCAAAYLVARDDPAGSRLVTLTLAATTAGWHWWWITSHPRWPGRLRPMIPYFAVLVMLVGALAQQDVIFLPMVFGICGMAFVALPGWWAYGGVAAAGLAVVATWDPAGPGGPWVLVAVFLLFTLVSGVLGGAFRFTEGQAIRRRQMIEELEVANQRLTALSEENVGLQAQLLGQARVAGALDERQRLAREIHDTLAQGLTAIVTQIEAADEAAPDPQAVRNRLDKVRALARESLAEARRSMQALRPGPLADTHLPQALAETAGRWSQTSDVAATVTVTGTVRRLHTEVEVTVLRVVQEALANVAKHAAASRVGVTLSYLEDVLLVDVRDDGVGFDPPGAGGGESGSGFGLTAMRQRVTRLAGRLELESAPGQGTALSVSVAAIPPHEGVDDD
jgi:signal transduction histidine kinase